MSTDVRAAPGRPMRADGRRNRELVLAAARAAFAEGGPDVAVAEIARRAGVGTATLFRHFPTKDDLAAAVLEHLFSEIAAALEEAVAMQDPWDSFVHALTAVAELQSSDRMFLRNAGPEVFSQERFANSSQAMMQRMAIVVQRAKAAGVVRADLATTDTAFVISAIGGATEHCGVSDQTPDLWRRYLGLILDGLRPEGAHPLAPPALTDEQLMASKAAAHCKT